MVETRVILSAKNGTITYEDSVDHFENGLLRLMGLSSAEFQLWLDLAEQAPQGSLLERLARGHARLRSVDEQTERAAAAVTAGPGGEPGILVHPRIAENPAFGLACDAKRELGWLVRPEGGGYVRVVDPPVYEQAYFEGDPKRAGGYGGYVAQAPWRLEKAHRQVRELHEVVGAFARVLDVGSGYGFFRKALEEAGVAHEGLEVSAHARAVALDLFGFETRDGSLEQHMSALRGCFDAITLWDLLEHVADPAPFLRTVAECVRPGGFVAVKTPNLDCPEAEMFGPHYHSLKREHLVYFTPASLTKAANEAGLRVQRMTSASHLLRGFVGEETCARWAAEGRGADLTAYLSKP